jgi:hypothetical protein
MAILGELGSDPERIVAVGRRNRKAALTRHDWVYRWNELFRVVGVEPSQRMAARQRRLKEMAGIDECAVKNDPPRNAIIT